MTIATYADLQTKIGEYLARSDLTSYIPDFIAGAEARIAFGAAGQFSSDPLRIRAMETSADITVTGGTGALPTGYLEGRRMYWDASPKRVIEQTSPEDFYRKWGGSTQGVPNTYIIEGDNILVAPQASGTIKALFYKKFDPIASASPVTWLLTNSPLVYVYGALLEATPFIRNDQRLPMWHAMFKGAVEALNMSNMRDRWSGSALAVRNDTGNP